MFNEKQAPLCMLNLNTDNAINPNGDVVSTRKITHSWAVNWRNTLPYEFIRADSLICSHSFQPHAGMELFTQTGNLGRWFNGGSQVWLLSSNLPKSNYDSMSKTSAMINLSIPKTEIGDMYTTGTQPFHNGETSRETKERFFITNIAQCPTIVMTWEAPYYAQSNWTDVTPALGIHSLTFYKINN